MTALTCTKEFFSSAPHKWEVATQLCNPSSWEVQAGGPGDQGYPWVHSKFQAGKAIRDSFRGEKESRALKLMNGVRDDAAGKGTC